MNTRRTIWSILMTIMLFGNTSDGSEPAPKRLTINLPVEIHISGKQYKTSKIDDERFIELFENLIANFNADSKKFGVDSGIVLTQIFGLENNPSAKGVFSISPMLNRDILITTIMVANKNSLDDDDFERFKQILASYSRRTEDVKERMLIAIIYGTLFAEWKDQ